MNIKTICFFGTYKLNYARNVTLKEGLIQCGVHVVEVHETFTDERMELPEDFTIKTTLHRIGRKVKILFGFFRQWKTISHCDAIVVLHPGHLDLPFAKILSLVLGKKLIFDTSISPYDTMFIGRTIASRQSIKAIAVKCIEGLLLRIPDKLFVDTPRMKEFIAKEFRIPKRRIFVVPLGAYEGVYKPKAQEKHTTINVLFFGLYNPMHGANHIMEAINMLKHEQHIRFILLGDGYLKGEFLEFAAKHNLTNIKFVGFVPEHTLVSHIQQADILLGVFSNSPVFQRAIPNKVFAALACKKALITARLAPVVDAFEDKKHLYLCRPEDPHDLARAIALLAHDETLRVSLAESGYKMFCERYQSDKVAAAFLKGVLL